MQYVVKHLNSGRFWTPDGGNQGDIRAAEKFSVTSNSGMLGTIRSSSYMTAIRYPSNRYNSGIKEVMYYATIN